jgi:intracellular septation protein
MKFLFDLFPVILFFVAFKIAGANESIASDFATRWLGAGIAPSQAPILIATAVAIIATFGQIAWVWLRHRKVDTMLWVSLAIIAVFGGATLYLHDETFIKWKPTVLYWLFAVVLGASALFFRRNLIRTMLGDQIQLPDSAWRKLNFSWVGFFACMGFLNLYVAFNYPTDTWVNFKLFGGMGLMLAFVIGQGLFLAKYVEQNESK